jgi:hypothetical protein
MAGSRHDRMLFEILMSHQRELDPDLRAGAMFGCPAAFAGCSLAFCVYRDTVGAKLPEDEAARLVADGQAAWFRPYDRMAMVGWVDLRTSHAEAARLTPILASAVRFARQRAAEKPKAKRN